MYPAQQNEIFSGLDGLFGEFVAKLERELFKVLLMGVWLHHLVKLFSGTCCALVSGGCRHLARFLLNNFKTFCEFACVADPSLFEVEHLNVGKILVGLPASEYQQFVLEGRL